MYRLGEMLGAVERRVHPSTIEVSTLEQFKATLTRQPDHLVIVEPLINVPSADKPSGLCGIRLSGRSINGRVTCTKLITQDEQATERDHTKTSHHLAHRVIRSLEKSGIEAYIGNSRGEVASIPQYLRED